MSAKRIQQRRTKGWRKPEGALSVARPSKWGNPWRIDPADPPAEGREWAVGQFRRYLRLREIAPGGWADLIEYPSLSEIRRHLAGKDLMCWCPLNQPCHADVLLELANGGTGT